MHRPFAIPRGVPLVGKGIKGTVPGTDPLGALLAKERRGRLQLQQRDPIARTLEEPHVRTRKRLGRRVIHQREL